MKIHMKIGYVKVELTDKSELDELMTSEEYEKFLDEEV